MIRPGVYDPDYLGAYLHGCRSGVADGGRLEALCRLPDLSELGRSVCPDTESATAKDIQRWLVQDLAQELASLSRHLDGTRADLLAWILTRLQIENIKLLVRGWVARVPLRELQEQMVQIPYSPAYDLDGLQKAESVEDLIERLPAGKLRRQLRLASIAYREQRRPFVLEAALDCGYLQELIARTELLPEDDKEAVKGLILQEIDIFHLMLALRGKFFYGLTLEVLQRWHIRGTRLSSEVFAAMVAEPDEATAAAHAVGRALDALRQGPEASVEPPLVDLTVIESLAWNRFLRLANRAFRRGHMGFGAVIGYVGIRRVEVANLITLSEGIRTGLTSEVISARMVPREQREAAYV